MPVKIVVPVLLRIAGFWNEHPAGTASVVPIGQTVDWMKFTLVVAAILNLTGDDRSNQVGTNHSRHAGVRGSA